MKTLKICLVILCLLHVRAVGLPRISGATFFMEENWLPIKGYEDHYEVSDLGRVRSKERFLWNRIHIGPRRHNALIKKQTPHYKNKYLSVMLKVNSEEKRVFVHRLVADHFIPNPENKPEVNHKFGDKNDNRACMLEWATALENTQHSIRIGLNKNQDPVLAIKDTSIIEFKSKKDCAKYIGCCGSWVAVAAKKGKVVNGFNLYLL